MFLKFHNLFCSINGFSSATTIKKINEKLLENIENFVRVELFDILQSLCMQRKTAFGDSVKKSFFGLHYANPSEFRFTQEEKKIIVDIGVNIKSESNTNEISLGLEQLCLNDNLKKDTFLGWKMKLTNLNIFHH